MKLDLKINITTLLAIALGVVVLFWWNGRKNDEISRWEDNYNAQSTEFVTYKDRTDQVLIGKNIAIQVLRGEVKDVVSNDSIQKELVRKYRRLALLNKTETVFVHDTVEIEVPIFIDKDTTVNYADNCFGVDISLFNGGLSLNNLSIQNTQDIASGARKNGLFKTEQAIDVRNSNPCIQTTGMTTYIVVEKKKWWENPIIVGLGGFGVGYTVGQLNK